MTTRLLSLVALICLWQIAAHFANPRLLPGPMAVLATIVPADKKIAAIAIVNKALLLTENRRDFEQFPGLRLDDWLD